MGALGTSTLHRMMNEIATNQQHLVSYVKQLRQYIAIATLLFVGAAVAGYVLTMQNNVFARQLVDSLQSVTDLLIQLQPWELFLAILLNNAIRIFLVIVGGVLFGLLPLFFVVSNGFFLGVLLFLVQQERGFGTFIAGIIPHGIIEIPVLIIGTAIGIRLGVALFQKLSNSQIQLKQEFTQGTRFFFIALLPALVLAAAIETFLTPAILNLFL